MLVAQNKLGTTVFLQEAKILVSVYKGRAHTRLALEHLAHIVEFYKSNKVLGAVVDLKEVHGSFAKVFGYMKLKLNPAAVKSGLKCQVYVLSQDLITNNLGLKLKEMAVSFKLKSEVFSDREEAKKWVKLNLSN